MKERPGPHEFSAYSERYIALVPEGDLIELFRRQGEETERLIRSLTEAQGDRRYAPGKWSLREVFGHVADNERIMSARLLRIARGDKTPLPGYDQDELMAEFPFSGWSLGRLADDYAAVRRSTISLLQGLKEEAWTCIGTVGGHPQSARATACIILGHELHHLSVIRERYLPS